MNSSKMFRPVVLGMIVCAVAFPASLTIKVKDAKAAALPDAAAKLTGESLTTPVALPTAADGSAKFQNLQDGKYKLIVQHDGCEDDEREISVRGDQALEITLQNAAPVAAVAQGYDDPNYDKLRQVGLGGGFVVENIVLKRDVGTITLKTGVLAFTTPVLGKRSILAFKGQGHFDLAPVRSVDKSMVMVNTGNASVSEDFDSAVIAFTDGTFEEVSGQAKTSVDAGGLSDILNSMRHKLRRQTEVPNSFVEAILQGESIVNLDAELLGGLYNPTQSSSFSVFLHGKKYGDLRFLINPTGAVPGMMGPEEVALVSLGSSNTKDAILYLTHYATELNGHAESSDETRRIMIPLHYKIQTTIGGNRHLAGISEMTFRPTRDGDRVFRLDLLATLRVEKVSSEGKQVAFIQEPRHEDSAFYIVLPAPTVKDKPVTVTIEYEGDKVIENAGGGSFAVGARESWYPSTNSFGDHATYDLTFRCPKKFVLVSVGKLVDQKTEGDASVTHWVSDVPLAVAGFNYGSFKVKSSFDPVTKYNFEAYATSELPDYLRYISEHAQMAPTAMANNALNEADNSVRLFTTYFGELPFGRLAVTQQPEFNFGQSWPSLVYLPVPAFLDSTQRYMLLSSSAFRFSEFIDELVPHEVSHQWWGHMVGWSSYHDQWMSEGFAFFSAGLYLQMMNKDSEKYMKYWLHARKTILDKNNFGNAANDAGPLWMGLRLEAYRTAGSYNDLVYRKGGYVLQMLRWMMWDANTHDDDFIAMMHDFVKTYGLKSASTEDFKAIAEKHMKPGLDLTGNHKLDWFFDEYVYGTQIPSYRLDYHLSKEPDGKVTIAGKITQSGVDNNFRMKVPVYLDFGEGSPVRLGNIAVVGSSTSQEFRVKLPREPRKVLLNYNYDVLAQDVSVNAQ